MDVEEEVFIVVWENVVVNVVFDLIIVMGVFFDEVEGEFDFVLVNIIVFVFV